MATYYIKTDGLDANSGLTEALAWLTLGKTQTKPIVAGDKVYVKYGTYAELLTITVVGTATAPIVFEGYYSTPGDFWTQPLANLPTITGSGARANCITTAATPLYHIFKGFNLTGATGVGFNANGVNYINFIKCRIFGNISRGVLGGPFNCFLCCQIDTNGWDGINITADCGIFYSKIFSNCATSGGYGVITTLRACIIGNLLYNNGKADGTIYQLYMDDQFNNVIGNIFDGCHDNWAGTIIGARFDSAYRNVLVNNLFLDCDTAVIANSNYLENNISLNNMFYSNTADETNWLTTINKYTTYTPTFIDRTGGDYRPLNYASPQIALGLDCNYLSSLVSYNDLGPFQIGPPFSPRTGQR